MSSNQQNISGILNVKITWIGFQSLKESNFGLIILHLGKPSPSKKDKNNFSYRRSQKVSLSQIHSERIIREFTPRRRKKKEAKMGRYSHNKQRNKMHLLLNCKGYGFKCMD